MIRVHLCASVVLNQSTNINSFESSNTWAYFSQGDSGLFTPGTSADSKYARSVANTVFWDVFS